MRRVAVALVHHPVLDRQSEIVTTAITNLDLHDIARSAHTYGMSDYFVAHPVAAQRELAERVRSHWVSGSGARRIPDRAPALALLRVVESLSNAIDALGGRRAVELWTTSAGAERAVLEHQAARQRLASDGPAVLIVLGTGWGLAPEVHAAADERLAPIRSPRRDGYNHLSVRAAAAILFDRLLGAP
jgi:hypothetical protein